METRKNAKNKSIRKFIILWMSLLVFCFVIIALTLVLSTNKLQSMSGRIFMDSMALEYAHQLETAILEERREDLLWRATNNPLYLEQTKVQTEELKNIIRQFSNSVTSPEEHLLIREIEKKFDLFETATIADPPIPIEKISVITDNLLQSVEKYRIQNRTQMAETIKVSSRLNTLVDRWSLFMIILVALMVAFGSITLINRIIHPVFVLIRTAKNFGQGDFSVKTPVYRNDELGALCETFNDMATGIKNNQQERLNFIATVAHDLKNPLVVVGAAARKLKKNNLSDDKQTIWLDYIIKNVEYLENLISDLMDSVQIESGKLTLHMSELDLTSLVSFIQQQQDELIKTHQIIFEGDSKCWIQGDTRRLERAVLNLVSNAIKYSPENSTILLKIERGESEARLIVKDEGFGIEEDEIPNLFLPFKRLTRTHDMADGTGLGLFSVKKIVVGHGGSINIDSKPGSGTTVEIVLPLIKNKE